MYTALLTVHSYLRWVVLLVGLLVLARAIAGVVQRRQWTPTDDSAARWFGMGLDIQLLIDRTWRAPPGRRRTGRSPPARRRSAASDPRDRDVRPVAAASDHQAASP